MHYKIFLEDKSFFIVDESFNLSLYDDSSGDISKSSCEISKYQNDCRKVKVDGKLYSFAVSKFNRTDEPLNTRLKKAIDIDYEDSLLKPDGGKNKILDLHRGFGQMYKITYENGSSNTVSYNHILHLVDENNNEKDIILETYLDYKNKDKYYMLDTKGNKIKFTVEKEKEDNYYGFLLEEPLYQTGTNVLFHNSGKSVLQAGIVAHVNKFYNDFQMVAVDLKQVEWSNAVGTLGFKAVAVDVATASAFSVQFKDIMKARFKMMREHKVNNIFKLPKNLQVDYYEFQGQKVQFDEIYEVWQDIDWSKIRDRDKSNYEDNYPSGRMPCIMTIEDIYAKYDTLRNPSVQPRRNYNPYFNKSDIKKTTGTYHPKALIMMVDEAKELMTDSNYALVEPMKDAFGSILRLGRAAAVHLVIAAQLLTNDVVNRDMMNNIQLKTVLGVISPDVSTHMFDKDISNRSKPRIKGRGQVQSVGSEVIEYQSFYTKEIDLWRFDPDNYASIESKIYNEQLERDGKKPDLSGFILDTTGPDATDEAPNDDIPISSDEVNKSNEEDDFDWDDAFLDEELSDTFVSSEENIKIPELPQVKEVPKVNEASKVKIVKLKF